MKVGDYSRVNRIIKTKFVGGAIVVLGVGLLLVWALPLVRAAQSARVHLLEAHALMDAPGETDVETACTLVRDLRADVVALDRRAGVLVRFAPILGWLPSLGGDMQAAPHLLAVADGMTDAGVLVCDTFEPLLVSFESEDRSGFSLEDAVPLLAEKSPDLNRALTAVGLAQDGWEQVETGSLSPWVAEKTGPLEWAIPLLRAGLAAATVAPDLLGIDEPQTYLVLALNEDELRPGGGLISGVGEVRLEDGRLEAMTFRDSYAVDDFDQPYPDPPEPLRRYLGLDLWVFRDSNWSPDFPTAAQQAIPLYRPGHPVAVDGMVALDQRALVSLVGALGPVEVEGAEAPVTGETVIAYIRQAWAPEDGSIGRGWWKQRKAFMGVLATAVWDRVQSGQVDWISLANTLMRLLGEKHLLIWSSHPTVAAILAEQGWDGAMRPGTLDFLMLVDANVGYNKASGRVQESMSYQVDLHQSPAEAIFTVVYTHTSRVEIPCNHEDRYEFPYEQMMDRCYWNYLRVYVPQGSHLVDATRIPIPGDALYSGDGESGEVMVQPTEEGPWLTFAALDVLPPASTHTRVFTWTLPVGVIQWDQGEGSYTLRVQKQPGSRNRQLSVRVRVPEGSTLLGTSPEVQGLEGEWVIYRTTLDRDRDFQLRFRREQ